MPAEVEVQVQVDIARLGDAAVEDLEFIEAGGAGLACEAGQKQGEQAVHAASSNPAAARLPVNT